MANWDRCCSSRGGSLRFICNSDIVSVPDHYGREDQNEQTQRYKDLCAAAGSVPLPQRDTPECAENHDAGHVESPARESIVAHLGLTHGVEEELQVPSDPGDCRKYIVHQH